MIQPLRVVHRRAFATLALVLPAILLIGLGARRSRPGPGARAADLPATAYVVRESNKLWQRHTIQSEFYSRSDRPQDIGVVLQSAEEFNEPDMLLYWAAIAPEGNSLPKERTVTRRLYQGRGFSPSIEREARWLLDLIQPGSSDGV